MDNDSQDFLLNIYTARAARNRENILAVASRPTAPKPTKDWLHDQILEPNSTLKSMWNRVVSGTSKQDFRQDFFQA